MTTETSAGSLVVTHCSKCGIASALPRSFRDERIGDHRQFYCPNGHSQYFPGETDADRLTRELKVAKDRAAAAVARADGAEASLRTTKGHVTRLRKQVLAGECPICGQHLRDLARHVARQHPDEQPEPVS